MNPLLYGHHPEERIVGLHQKDDQSVRLYFRKADQITHRDELFYPFFFLAESSLLENFGSHHWLKELEGDNPFRYVCAFETWPLLWEAVRHLLDTHNRRSVTRADSYTSLDSIYLLPDPLTQYLLQSGRTFFKGMRFEELRRLQLDIETYSSVPGSYGRASRSGDRIILVSLSDSTGWEELLDGRKMDEPQMLSRLAEIIRERDPDVIEGHNLYEFDLPYILKRCELHGLPFNVGRDGSLPTGGYSKSTTAPRPGGFAVTEIAGRSVIDTYVLVRAYDQSKHVMERYGLKYAAQFFGFAAANRTYIPGERISWHWDHDPEPLCSYAMDDVRETRALSGHLSGTYFYQSQMLPMTYTTVLRTGSSAKIENLMLREYLRMRHSIPRQTGGFQTTGGYTDIFSIGVLGPVVHADIESLYPSIMIRQAVTPRGDILGIFPVLLKELTDLRLEAKKQMKKEEEPRERSRLDALQSSLKILINSFYGYLGYARGLFNDFAKADLVTTEGQRLLRMMIAFIRESGSQAIEVDTDGIFFVPPPSVNTAEEEHAFVRTLSRIMPPGIVVALDGRYRKMLSYKKKNYALLGYDGQLLIKGSSLTSRSIEKFGREYIRRCITALLNGDIRDLHSAYLDTRNRIQDRALTVGDFARVEALGETPAEYLAAVDSGRRPRGAAYEVALRMDRSFRRGDKVAYYISGNEANLRGFENARPVSEWDPNFPDENVPYYLKRLDEFSEKFRPFFTPQDYQLIFSPEGLFPFSAADITIQETSVVVPDGTEGEEPESEQSQ
jgi:DNA polymerase elongation subunit (family B)